MESGLYQSVYDFKSQKILNGTFVKPEIDLPAHFFFPEDVRKIMDRQRAIQQIKPKNERIFIGGRIQAFHLTKSKFEVYTLDQFEDYESNREQIFKNFNGS